MNQFLFGAIFLGFACSSLFFLRFWRRSQDPLFLLFAISFALLGIERVVMAFFTPRDEIKSYVFLIRLCAFLVILVAIINKNRGKHQ